MSENSTEIAPAAPVDQDALAIQDLARAVLEQGLRPRAAAIRRLAQAVLAPAAPEPAAKAKKDKKSKKDAPKMDGGKKRKLAKIPGQKK